MNSHRKIDLSKSAWLPKSPGEPGRVEPTVGPIFPSFDEPPPPALSAQDEVNARIEAVVGLLGDLVADRPLPTKLGRRVLALCYGLGVPPISELTQRELAELLGVSESAVCHRLKLQKSKAYGTQSDTAQ